MKKNLQIQTRSVHTVNSRRTARERVGMALRALAGLIDGRVNCAHDFMSMPPVSKTDVYKCISLGNNHTTKLLEELVCLAAVESGMKEIRPDLFQESQHE